MKKILIPFAILAVFSCGGGRGGDPASAETSRDAPQKQLIEMLSPAPLTRCKPGETVAFHVQTTADVDSVAIYASGRHIPRAGRVEFKIPVETPLGRYSWHATAYDEGDSSVRYGDLMLLAAEAPEQYGFKVIKSYPHNTSSYTQGLLWHEGCLYESTGLEGRSALIKVDLATGRDLQRHNLDSRYFGEGLALVGDKFYQVTWQNGTAFVYDSQTLKPVNQFTYTGEGWGLTTDGRTLYMSDGTDRIYKIDPTDFTRKGHIQVCTDKSTVNRLNELEWVEGEIWANVYTLSRIVRIDPATGRVKGIIDLTGILPEDQITDQTDVLNGIAYDPVGRKIYVTGKNWSRLFEIEVVEKR